MYAGVCGVGMKYESMSRSTNGNIGPQVMKIGSRSTVD